jgi:hypothetical protein
VSSNWAIATDVGNRSAPDNDSKNTDSSSSLKHEERLVGDLLSEQQPPPVSLPLTEITSPLAKPEETASQKDLDDLSDHSSSRDKKKCKGNLDYKQFLKEFYTILACRSLKSSALNNSAAHNESGDAYMPTKKPVQKSKEKLMESDDENRSTLTSASSLHSLNSMSSQLLKTLTYEKLKPIEFIAEDFDHDDYIDLSFSSEKKAYYQAKMNESESKRSSFTSNTVQNNKKQPFDFKSCFFNNNNNEKSLINDGDRKAIRVVVECDEDDTDLESDIDSEFDVEFARPKLYGWLMNFLYGCCLRLHFCLGFDFFFHSKIAFELNIFLLILPIFIPIIN